MTDRTFDLPDLGEGLTEAEVVRWLVSVGETVALDQPVAEVETAKSIVEVPSPFAGTVSALHGEEGAVVEVGRPLITVATGEPPVQEPDPGPAGTAGAAESAEGEASAAAERYREEERAGTGSGNVLVGYGTPETGTRGRNRRPRTRTPERGAGGRSVPLAATGTPATPAPGGRPRVPLVTSPLVRQMAREAGIRVAGIEGSGPNGLIMRKDVRAAIAASAPATNGAAPAGAEEQDASDTPAPAIPASRPPSSGASRVSVPGTDPRTGLPEAARVPMTGFRKSVADTLSRSRREIPEATVWVDVDATELVRLRRAHPDGPGIMAYVARFVVAGLRAHPELNGIVDTERGELVQYDGVNLGLAVQTDRGLVAPAVLGAHRYTTAQLDTEIRRLTEAAREGRASPAEMTGGTFTLNNYGALRVDGSAAIINHPQAAILGLGRIMDRPWIVDGQVTARKITQLSFAFDHRVCDGGTAAGFMRVVADAMEDPAAAIADL
ncbi:dihydrolipoamide acetyltransferase family protein [Nocardiopsis kunsanensis]|uniref:Dihydrolipoamide acetyltransferase component of pyruvate dehydrogenase complex n=1 Tax=Nocardiopsis kunsanensis TaxID=141693 RepID=A0A918XIX3_9ACTN|nr:dihydrolipoamide acetyltransferase family protein [Nocardiopsis kunsanensis]GHD32704.1 dihydrolipoamide acetyltransferase component of pyruvate dehydrogenase complex [Nocardiopsis kunsanensis]